MAFQKKVSTEGMQVGQAPDIILTDGSLAKGGLTLEPVDKPLNKDYLDALAFMEEEMEITVMETSDENAENPVMVGCNGVFVQFPRGIPVVAKRKFVDCLIVKNTRVNTPEIQVQGVKGGSERSFTIRQASAHKYPFQVNSDRNPKGAEWLKQRMAEVV